MGHLKDRTTTLSGSRSRTNYMVAVGLIHGFPTTSTTLLQLHSLRVGPTSSNSRRGWYDDF